MHRHERRATFLESAWNCFQRGMLGLRDPLCKASPFSIHADASLRETITVMSARRLAEALVTVPVPVHNCSARGTDSFYPIHLSWRSYSG